MSKQMKKYLRGVIAKKKAEIKRLEQKNEEADSVEEVRSIGATLLALRDEINEAEAQLTVIEEEEVIEEEVEESNLPVEDPKDYEEVDEEEFVASKRGTRRFRPVATFSQRSKPAKGSPYATMEYRMAFKDYVQRGVKIPAEFRDADDPVTTVAGDIGAIIPETIMNEFIEDVSKVYGQVYNKVRKLNIKGGVKFPISKLKASFKWITETTVSDKQKAGDIKDFVEFSYNLGEIRVANTLLAEIVSLDMFEGEIVRIMTEAYVEAMDKGIISGTGAGQLLGITVDERVTNVVEFTEAEFGDWTAWRKKLFAHVPLSKRGQGEFLFTPATVEAYLLTMKDKNDRPIFREATDITMDNLAGSFYGRGVTLVEPDVIGDFATADEGDVVGIFWVPSDYAINTNMEFGIKRYVDEDTNEVIHKALTVVDGKILDPSGCYIIKKAGETSEDEDEGGGENGGGGEGGEE